MPFNFGLSLFKRSVKLEELRYKTCLGFEFIKKNFISIEKSRTVTKVKLVTKIKKPNQFYFGTLILASYCYCGYNA